MVRSAKARRARASEVATSSASAEDSERLRLLYEIGKLLVQFESVYQTVAEVIALTARAIPLRGGVLLLDTGDALRVRHWSADELDAGQRARADVRARTSYAFFAAPSSHRPPFGPHDKATTLALPLVGPHRRIIGLLDLEPLGPLGERDLFFANAVVAQLSVAIGRDVAIRAEQRRVERSRVSAEEARDFADSTRRRAELRREQADAERARFEALVDNLDSAFVWEADAATVKISYVSGRVESLLGYPRAHWLADDSLLDRVHPDDVETLRNAFDLALSEAHDRRCEHRCVAADGRVVWLRTGVHAVHGHDAPPTLQGVSVDITAAKSEEQRVGLQLGLNQAVTGSLGEAVVAVDGQAHVTLLNRAAEALLGCRQDAVLGAALRDVLDVRDADGAFIASNACPVMRVLQSGVAFRSEEHLFGPRGGAAIPVSCSVAPMKDGIRITGAVVSFRDVLELKRHAERQRFLAETSATLSRMLDYEQTLVGLAHASVPFLADICFVDEAGVDGAEARREVVVADPRGRGLVDAIRAQAPRPHDDTPQARALATGASALIVDTTNLVADRVARDEAHAATMHASGLSSMLVVPLRARGHNFGAVTFVRTSARRAYTELDLAFVEEVAARASFIIDNARMHREAQQAAGERQGILGVVTHDLRNPLSTIIVATDALLKGLHVEADAVRLGFIRRSAARMERMLDDLVDVTSVDAGRLSIEVEIESVLALLQEACHSVEHAAHARNVSLRVQVVPADLRVYCDHQRIVQVVVNLLTNAIKFTSVGTEVLIGAESAGGKVCVRVTDFGAGISRERQAHVFERHWQAPETSRMGMGLGLFISKGIVEAHGGTLEVHSEVGSGSTFSFTLLPAGDSSHP